MNVYFFIRICIFCVGIYGYHFPENFLRCNLSDTNLDHCMVEVLQNTLDRYGKTGIPSLKLPQVDPIDVSKMEIGAGTAAVNLVQKYFDSKIYGLADTKIIKAHWNHERRILHFTAEYPELRQEAKYDISGKVLMLSVYGIGDSTIRLENPTVIHKLSFVENFKNGKKYLHLEDYSVKLTIKGAHYNFENMFDGDKNLQEIVLKVLNDNWNVIFDDVENEVERKYGEAFRIKINEFFDFIPFDELFLK